MARIKERIGVVGTGRMGANMARRLKDCGVTVAAVFDARARVARRLAAELGGGCEAPRKLARVTALSDIVLTVVSDDAAMEGIFARNGDSLLCGADGRLFINCATVSAEVHQRVELRVTGVGASVLEACMASSIPQARDGSLYLMCGGTQAAYQRARPLLRLLGKTVRHIGGTGDAARLKLIVNMIMIANTAALAEGLALSEAAGLDLTMAREVFAETGAASRVLVTDGEDMQRREHDCYFSAEHAAKDVGLAVRMARKARLKLPVAVAAQRQYERMKRAGLGDLDKSGVSELTFCGRSKGLPR
ncbi:MAG: NAD(P)-dependent oxidoreductase [Verrucomicrobiales bacterium]|nr:NAD(P)-dependent oxidoreductase [Verrucomicrobiales bacterium]